ncbi:MAG: hypothetical protein Q4A07_12275, partial [Coriobacteriales bacterium]|nr:hypothetical protein [Coriobacteriales bacterium]
MSITKNRVLQLLDQFATPIALLWLELVFKLSTTGGLWPQVLFVLLFSVAAGLFVELLASLLPHARTTKITKMVVMGLAGVVFCVEYFVYREFKLFYDLKTVLGGAGDAATGFTDQILALVFSPAGIVHILLFMLPVLAYARWGTGETGVRNTADPLTTFAHAMRNCALTWIVALLAVSIVEPFEKTYSSQYTFDAAVSNFGLVTGLRKEVMGLASGKSNNVTFSQSEQAQASTDTKASGNDTA